ncbi:c-type cytochrome [Oxalicibacterium solurbis]|uniref:Cytochrome c n=1 Tax=Oxalicibacterium solurbis TaxID=69280 RepID=A0A8J3AXE5_9BURK|nr:c-type cytochrome [Oxalicibacterium solurbis]GGI54965.1 cytochrome c [Oxalicibacterium solurbis]
MIRRIALAFAGALMLAACSERDARPLLHGDPAKGRIALTQYGCQACHVIPGITGSDVHVGPPLEGLASRDMIAGSLPNTPDNLVRWIRDPQAVDPQTAMPNMGVSEAHAQDIAAYLATLK